VFKEILTQVGAFASALENFKEGQINEIGLPEDEPKVIAKIVEYLYRNVLGTDIDATTSILCSESGDDDSKCLFSRDCTLQPTSSLWKIARIKSWITSGALRQSRALYSSQS